MPDDALRVLRPPAPLRIAVGVVVVIVTARCARLRATVLVEKAPESELEEGVLSRGQLEGSVVEGGSLAQVEGAVFAAGG